MPYKRTYRKRTYRKRAIPKPVKSYVNSQIAKAERRESPLNWADLGFTGDSVSAAGNAYSLVKTFIEDSALSNIDAWPVRTHSNGTQYKEVVIKIESLHWQLRYENSDNDIFATIRHMFYCTSQSIAHNTSPALILQDVDSAPDTANVLTAYNDTIRTLRNMQANPDFSAPGVAVSKGTKRIGRNFKVVVTDLANPMGSWYVEDNDIVFEDQSNSTVVPHPSLYGFIRIYGRVMY